MKKIIDEFINKINKDHIKLKSYLPIYLALGCGAEDIKNIFNIKHSLGDFSHTDFKLFNQITSLRACFFQWFLYNKKFEYYDENSLIIPEHIPGWHSFDNGYTNLLDFETDLISLSSGILIFLESPGSICEFGAISILEESINKCFFVIKQENLGNGSYIELGPIKKLNQENDDGCSKNKYVFTSLALETQFEKIFNHFNELVIKECNIKINKEDVNHIILLTIDFIALFSKNSMKNYIGLKLKWIFDYIKTINPNFDKAHLKNILAKLTTLGIIDKRSRGNDSFYVINELYQNKNINLCKYYQAPNSINDTLRVFDKTSFQIELREHMNHLFDKGELL